MSQESKIQLPALGPNSWRSGALALLELMTPEGQQAALKSWAIISERAGGPFTPMASATPVMAIQPERGNGLLDNITVLDLEFQGNDLLELAAIRYERWEKVEDYQSFVHFTGPINGWVSNLTGITSATLKDAPGEREVLTRFKALAKDSILVAHNVLTADRRVLEAARARQGAKTPLPNRWLCTMALAKLRLPKDQKCGLSDLCQLFKIANEDHHRAMNDAEACYQVLRQLHIQQPITELVTSTAKAKNVGQTSLFPVAA